MPGCVGVQADKGVAMSIGVLALLAVIPILIALILMVGLRWPATRAMPLAISGVIGWKLDILYLAALSLQGVVVAIGQCCPVKHP